MQAVQANPLQVFQQNPGLFPIQTPDMLVKGADFSPTDLGLNPIQNYDYLTVSALRIAPRNLESVTENINILKTSPLPYFYLTNDNPFIAEQQLDGQIVWKAVDSCVAPEVEALGQFLIGQNQSIHVNTGSHGDHKGNMVSDVFKFERPQLQISADKRFFLEDIFSFRQDPTKASVHLISTEAKPIYPERANHVIDAWCFSVKSHFTPERRYLDPRDILGNFIPSIFKCVVSQRILTNPRYSPTCDVIKGQKHYYDIKAVSDLIRQNQERIDALYNPNGNEFSFFHGLKNVRKAFDDTYVNERPSNKLLSGLGARRNDIKTRVICRLEGCSNVLDLAEMIEDKHLQIELSKFKEVLKRDRLKNVSIQQLTERDLLNVQKIDTLRAENLTKDQRIDVLEEENEHLVDQNTHLIQENQEKAETIVVLEEEKTDLKGRVTDLTGERNFEREAKLEAFDRLNIREQRIEQLEEKIDIVRQDPNFRVLLAEEMERLNIQEKPSIQEFIKSNLLSKRYTPTQWQKKLSALKHEAEYWLAGILQGRLFDRVNAYISQGVTEDHEEKHRRIVETLLVEIKQRVIALVRNKMAYYSTDLIDTFIVGEFQVRYNNAEFKEFLEPLMEKLIKEDFLSNRVVEITKNENISIQELPSERWDEHEPGRYAPRTYKETMESILSYALQIELCDQLLAANIGR